jgi:lipid-binding SYLF domain-containing protein
MKKSLVAIALVLSAGTARADHHEMKTIELATDTVRAVSGLAVKGLPPAVLREAAGIAVIPHVVKAGLVVDERFGRGVVLVRTPDGHWSHPVFVTLTGHGIGMQAGIETTDLVLIFKTRKSIDRAMRGKLVLGTDASVAAGPLGHEIDRATDSPWLRAEIFSYSRSRGLFAGLALEGSVLHVDGAANDSWYETHGCRADDVLARRGAGRPPVELLRVELERLGGPLVPVAAPPAPRIR